MPTASPSPVRDGGAVESRWWPLGVVAGAASLMAVWFTLCSLVIPQRALIPQSAPGYTGDWLLGGRARWDAHWFHLIATDGYSAISAQGLVESPAFFPGYPALMRLGAFVVGDAMLAGVIVSVVAGVVGACLFYRWAEERIGTRSARVGLLALLVYPYSFYLFGVVYSDALFFACAVGAFVLLDKDRPVLAGLVAALACSTRLVGVAVVAGLVLRLLENRGVLAGWSRWRWAERFSRPARPIPPGPTSGSDSGSGSGVRLALLRPRDAGVLLGLVGAAVYPIYLWVRFDNPLLFQDAGKTWGQGNGWRTLLKADTFSYVLIDGTNHDRVALVFQVALLLGALGLSGAVLRRFGWAYAGYVVLAVGVPLVTVGNLYGSGRYVFGAFPSFAALGALLATRTVLARRLAAGSVVVMAACIALYVGGQFVA